MNPISLLYETPPSGPVPEKKALREAIYNLNVDRVVDAACKNRRAAAYFLSVLSKPVGSEKDSLYRADILRDFIRNPALLSGLVQLFRSYDRMKSENDEMTAGIFHYGIPSSESGISDAVYEELYVSAHFARSVIACFGEMLGLFSSYEITSEGLRRMKELCVKINESKCIEEVEKAAEVFRSENPEAYRFTVEAVFDRTLTVDSVRMVAVSDKNEKVQKKLSIRDLFKKKDGPPDTVDIGSEATDNVSASVTWAMTHLSGIFSDIADGIYNAFYGIGDELMFYSVACDLASYVGAAGLSVVFPEVLPKEADVFRAEGVADPLLVTEGKTSANIVTNNVTLDGSGIIAMGDNNCGKTSFLRAIGCGMLFAASGLFVCADKMTVSLRDGIFTHFSSAEKDFSDGDAAGRFEGEVKDVARIMESLTPYSVVLLNETFQTTAYREGAEGMKAILDFLPSMKVRYVFVTHMKAMFGTFEPEGVTLLRAENFSLVPFGTPPESKK